MGKLHRLKVAASSQCFCSKSEFKQGCIEPIPYLQKLNIQDLCVVSRKEADNATK